MSAIFRGSTLPVLVSQFPSYNAETNIYTISYEYKGSENGIRGLESQFKARQLSYRVTHDGPIWSMTVEEPIEESNIDDVDRWEVYTESTEKSLFELPDVVEIAVEYDAARTYEFSDTFKSEIEESIDSGYSDLMRAFLSLQTADVRNTVANLITHLRAGVTGWQLDLVGIRRSRRLDRDLANFYRIGLDDGLTLYTTAQLGLPADVSFSLPTTPSNVSTIFSWRWRKRSQRVEYVGQYVDQTVELLFAPWSLMAYSESSSNLIW